MAGGVCRRFGGDWISCGLPVVRAATGQRFAPAGVQRLPEFLSSDYRTDLLSGREVMAAGEMLSDQPDLCRSCCEERFAFDAARSPGVYRESLVRVDLLLKHAQVEPLGAWFAKRLSCRCRCIASDSSERGFNQMELFARPLAKLLKLPYRPVLLVRKRPRPEKHLLTKDEPGGCTWRFCNGKRRTS